MQNDPVVDDIRRIRQASAKRAHSFRPHDGLDHYYGNHRLGVRVDDQQVDKVNAALPSQHPFTINKTRSATTA